MAKKKFDLDAYRKKLKDFVKSLRRAYIYKIENKINGKVYIGLTTRNPSKRWREHCNPVSHRGRSLIKDAIKHHGEVNFTFEVIEETNQLEMSRVEANYIRKYNSLAPNGYNCLVWDDRPEITESTKELMSKAKKGKKPWNAGKKGRQEAWNKGIPNKRASIPIIAINNKTGEITEYESSMEAVRHKGFNSGHITQCCKGKLKQHKGYTFKYKYDYDQGGSNVK